MEIKANITLWVFGVVSLILNYYTKFQLANLASVIRGARDGLAVMSIASVVLRRIGFFQKRFTIFSPDTPTFRAYACCWAGGVLLGAYGGFNLSVIEATKEFTFVKSWIIYSHCVGSLGTAIVLYFSECNYWCRYLFRMIYSSNSQLSATEHLSSFVSIFVASDYVATCGILYLGFFAVMYYCIYLVAVTYPFWIWLSVGLFCGSNLLVGLVRVFYLRPKINEINSEKIFRETFPFSV